MTSDWQAEVFITSIFIAVIANRLLKPKRGTQIFLNTYLSIWFFNQRTFAEPSISKSITK
ncbi:hypothetical protein DBO85_00085 [Pseudomonas mangrovi]|uniref:Uncharacterized protein n=1 Tax=Pseudomonas mangrovi TaxID=2161748 RepID=A0A2T5PEC2_9PSED|nr:hypothetical protein DBO85_00085 [Pseudomonas mangrovi]